MKFHGIVMKKKNDALSLNQRCKFVIVHFSLG